VGIRVSCSQPEHTGPPQRNSIALLIWLKGGAKKPRRGGTRSTSYIFVYLVVFLTLHWLPGIFKHFTENIFTGSGVASPRALVSLLLHLVNNA